MTAELVAQTERTEIYKIRRADAPFIFELMHTPSWLEFIGDRGLNNVEDADKYVRERFLASYKKRGFGYYIVRNRSEDMLGIAGFLKRPDLRNVDFGFAFMPRYQRQGYGYEVGKALLAFAKSSFGFEVLDAVTLEKNTASRKLLEKLQFSEKCKIIMGEPPEEVLLYQWRDRNGE